MTTHLVTGASGWVGRALTDHLSAAGAQAVAWDRAAYPPTDRDAIDACLADHAPDVVYHLAMCSEPTGTADNEHDLVNRDWPHRLARWCALHDARLVYTSSVMVYTDDLPGPYTPDTEPDNDEGYGLLKRQIEHVVRDGAPSHAVVCRLGWQLADEPTGNNMLRHLTDQHNEKGRIDASSKWLPACSHVAETARALYAAGTLADPGTYLVSTNTRRPFTDIVRAISDERGLNWTVNVDDSYAHDQRMLDDRLWRLLGMDGTPDGPAVRADTLGA
ncbi:MAG: hypothetical protein Tsb0013_15690 [Phycisphaerales bacterium]